MAWVGIDDMPAVAANQVASQFTPEDGFTVIFGQANPPIIVSDDPEEVRRAFESVPFVPVRPVARLAITPARMREVVEVLTRSLARYDMATTPAAEADE